MRFSTGFVLVLSLAACSGSHGRGEDDAGSAPTDSCEVPSDCALVSISCCGSCGAVVRGDATAVNRANVAAHRAGACPEGAGCPACLMEQDPTLLATCEAGRCVVVDLQAHAATTCASSADCRVRAVECCECGASITASTVVAVSDPGAIEALVCDPGTACPECLPDYPDELVARCEGGRCVMVVAGP